MLNILLVDDNKHTIEELGYALTIAGISYIGETNPVKALTLYKAGKYDAVIVDCRMPQMDGISFIKEVRAFNANAIVIMLTATVESDIFAAAMKAGAYAFFSKHSLDMRQLINCINQINIISE